MNADVVENFCKMKIVEMEGDVVRRSNRESKLTEKMAAYRKQPNCWRKLLRGCSNTQIRPSLMLVWIGPNGRIDGFLGVTPVSSSY